MLVARRGKSSRENARRKKEKPIKRKLKDLGKKMPLFSKLRSEPNNRRLKLAAKMTTMTATGKVRKKTSPTSDWMNFSTT